MFFKVLKIQIFSISSQVIAKTPKALEIAQEMISKKLHFFFLLLLTLSNYCMLLYTKIYMHVYKRLTPSLMEDKITVTPAI